jgi:hypothetical protein
MKGPRNDTVIGTERIAVHRQEADGILGKQAKTSFDIRSTHIKVVHALFHHSVMTCPLLEDDNVQNHWLQRMSAISRMITTLQ